MLHPTHASCSFLAGLQPPEPGGVPQSLGFLPSLQPHRAQSAVPRTSVSVSFPSDGTRCQEPENSCMAAPGPHSLSAAFQKHLRRLGLRDFPCGLGSWVGAGGTAVGQGASGGVLQGANCFSTLCRTSPALSRMQAPQGRRRRGCWVRRALRRCWSCCGTRAAPGPCHQAAAPRTSACVKWQCWLPSSPAAPVFSGSSGPCGLLARM